MVDELSQGMVLKPAVKYQRISTTKGVPRDSHKYSKSRIRELALVTDPQDANHVTLQREPAEGDKSGLASGDDQLPQTILGRATDERVIGQAHHCAADGCDLGSGECRVILCIEFECALQVPQSTGGERYLRQDLGLGRLARLPSARAVK